MEYDHLDELDWHLTKAKKIEDKQFIADTLNRLQQVMSQHTTSSQQAFSQGPSMRSLY